MKTARAEWFTLVAMPLLFFILLLVSPLLVSDFILRSLGLEPPLWISDTLAAALALLSIGTLAKSLNALLHGKGTDKAPAARAMGPSTGSRTEADPNLPWLRCAFFPYMTVTRLLVRQVRRP